MRNIFTSIALVLLTSATVNAQVTTATDFNAMDCDAVSHNLFSELNSGKVIVLTWVMPCSACVGPAKAAYNAVQSYAASHPGKVLFYLVDDYGDATCSSLNTWINNEGIGDPSKMTIFDNMGVNIAMNNYGAAGMPKTIVVGGTNHKVYMNKNNSSANAPDTLTAAINAALGITSVADLNNAVSFSVSPNPANSDITINTAKAVSKVTITAMNGQVVNEEVFTTAKMNPSIKMTQLANGVYMVKITDVNNQSGVQQIVKQ